MLAVDVASALRPRHILCLGAHCDDIEIGCGGTVSRMVAANRDVSVTWVVLGSTEQRAQEALLSADTVLAVTQKKTVVINGFRDGFFPYHGADLKQYFEELKATVTPDLVFTHYRNDLHQDHRLVSELTWNTFRDHLVLEYEVPKFDGDLGAPNAFVEIDGPTLDRKIDHLLTAFPSQAGKDWFTAETFRGLARLRGIECRAASGYAEAFYGRKLRLA
jgi:LmbE family N-acetylglucosaminyl deacetylase